MAGESLWTDYGKISESFSQANLGEVCVDTDGVQTGPFGSQLHNHDYVEVGTPIITVEHLAENRITQQNLPKVSDSDVARLVKYTLQEGDIVFSRVGSVDRRALVRKEEDGWMFSGRCLRVRPNPEIIDSRYLSWFFGHRGFQEHIRRIAVGATMPSINTKILSNVEVYFPPLPEQRAIASILGALDDKIELNRRMNATMESLARAIFRSWFVDFDPVRTKSEGRPVTSENSAASPSPVTLPPAILDLFPSTFQDSELGKIPEGWEIGTLGDVTDVQGGFAFKSKDFDTAGHCRVVKIKNIQDDRSIDIHDVEFLPDSFAESSSEFLLVDGDVLMAMTGAKVAKFGILVNQNEPSLLNQRVARFRPMNDTSPWFVYCALTIPDVLNQVIARAEGSAQPNVSAAGIKAAELTVPRWNLVSAFCGLVNPMFERIISNTKAARTLSTLRDTLLPKLLSGELPVPAALTATEEAIA